MSGKLIAGIALAGAGVISWLLSNTDNLPGEEKSETELNEKLSAEPFDSESEPNNSDSEDSGSDLEPNENSKEDSDVLPEPEPDPEEEQEN